MRQPDSTRDGIGMPLIRIRDLADESRGVFTAEEHPKGYLVQPGDIVVGMDGGISFATSGAVSRVGSINESSSFPSQEPVSRSPFVLHSIVGLRGVGATETATTVMHLGTNRHRPFHDCCACASRSRCLRSAAVAVARSAFARTNENPARSPPCATRCCPSSSPASCGSRTLSDSSEAVTDGRPRRARAELSAGAAAMA